MPTTSIFVLPAALTPVAGGFQVAITEAALLDALDAITTPEPAPIAQVVSLTKVCGEPSKTGGSRQSLCGGRTLPLPSFRYVKSGDGSAAPYRLCVECEKAHDRDIQARAHDLVTRYPGLFAKDEARKVIRRMDRGATERQAIADVLGRQAGVA